MDIKWKSNKIKGILISVLLLFVLAAGISLCSPILNNRKELYKTPFYTEYNFSYEIGQNMYALYWDAQKQWSGNDTLEPAELFIPEFIKQTEKLYGPLPLYEDSYYGEETYEETTYEEAYGEETYEETTYEGTASTMQDTSAQKTENANRRLDKIRYVNRNIENSFSDLLNMKNLHYAIQNEQTKAVITNSDSVLTNFLTNGAEKDKLLASYQYLLALRYDENGNLRFIDAYGKNIEQSSKNWSNEQTRMRDFLDLSPRIKLNQPKNITFVFAVPQVVQAEDWIGRSIFYSDFRGFYNAGYPFLYLAIIGLSAVFGLLFSIKQFCGLGNGITKRLPIELLAFCSFFVLCMHYSFAELAYNIVSGSWHTRQFTSPGIASLADYTFYILYLMLALGIIFVTFLSLGHIFKMGLRNYLKERSLFVRFLQFLKHLGKKVWLSISTVDLTKPVAKKILKLLILHFIILSILCCLWIFGIFGLVVYCIILFYFSRKYFTNLQRQYEILLRATGAMANGRLDIEIQEDLGVFNPLKHELTKIQAGFKKAVEMEVKSQNMKTELVTNVSHDLKTPLTAIITYIDLLKNPEITPEDRSSYIETLERKSLKLKQLIEDLFEVSKANSKNVTLHYATLDLGALLKQIQSEYSDKIQASQIEFRWNMPNHKVLLSLDGQKTSRAVENLVLNITKYALPGTRAYINLEEDEQSIKITMKNISAVEIDFNEDEITERFVRGDKSRNTEGSGLGLAIAKSFIEVQGGAFHIQVDGDLFKTEICFLKQKKPILLEQTENPTASDWQKEPSLPEK